MFDISEGYSCSLVLLAWGIAKSSAFPITHAHGFIMVDGLSMVASLLTLAEAVAEAIKYVRTLCRASEELEASQVRSTSRDPVHTFGQPRCESILRCPCF